MPIFEFKCSRCEHFFEMLVMNEQDRCEACCPACKSEEFERVLSTTSYAMGSSESSGPSAQTRSCSSGSCTTYDIPGHSR